MAKYLGLLKIFLGVGFVVLTSTERLVFDFPVKVRFEDLPTCRPRKVSLTTKKQRNAVMNSFQEGTCL